MIEEKLIFQRHGEEKKQEKDGEGSLELNCAFWEVKCENLKYFEKKKYQIPNFNEWDDDKCVPPRK